MQARCYDVVCVGVSMDTIYRASLTDFYGQEDCLILEGKNFIDTTSHYNNIIIFKIKK